MLYVEPARGPDLQRVHRIAVESLSEVYGMDWLAAHMAQEEILVARDLPSDDLVGFAVTTREEPALGHLLAMAVDARYRSRGVGGALLHEVKEAMARRGAMCVCLEVRLEDSAAQAFYARHGFRPEGLEDHVYRDGGDAVRYACPV
jgi:ribosomal protein S18 acetylase RimI-like enzyme